MNNTAIVTRFCRELHPETQSDLEAVRIYQKELQRIIDFKIKYNISASEDIEMFFILHQAWNEMKAEELMAEEIVYLNKEKFI